MRVDRAFLLASFVALAAPACGHSEDEMQAMLAHAREECAVETMHAKSISPPSEARGCGKDTDCKRDRVCELGRCTAPQ